MSGDFVKIPGFDLGISPEWAEAMGFDPSRLERAEPSEQVMTFTVGEMQTWNTDPEGLIEPASGGRGYVYSVDRDTGTVGVCNSAPIDADDPSGPALLYSLAVQLGAQQPVSKCWPKS